MAGRTAVLDGEVETEEDGYFDPSVTADDFDMAVGAALADAAAGAPHYEEGEAPAREPILFEGRKVDRTEIVIKGLTNLSDAYEGIQIGLDDRVRLVIETRGAKVNHYVDKDGNLVRSQELKVLVADIVPWDPTNAADDGILRA